MVIRLVNMPADPFEECEDQGYSAFQMLASFAFCP